MSQITQNIIQIFLPANMKNLPAIFGIAGKLPAKPMSTRKWSSDLLCTDLKKKNILKAPLSTRCLLIIYISNILDDKMDRFENLSFMKHPLVVGTHSRTASNLFKNSHVKVASLLLLIFIINSHTWKVNHLHLLNLFHRPEENLRKKDLTTRP